MRAARHWALAAGTSRRRARGAAWAATNWCAPSAAEEALRRADTDPWFRAEDLRAARAEAALYAGTPEGRAEVLRVLEGDARPASRRLRALALTMLQRLEEAVAELDAALAEWPRWFTARQERGVVRQTAGLAAFQRGEPADALPRRRRTTITRAAMGRSPRARDGAGGRWRSSVFRRTRRRKTCNTRASGRGGRLPCFPSCGFPVPEAPHPLSLAVIERGLQRPRVVERIVVARAVIHGVEHRLEIQGYVGVAAP